MRPLIGNDWTSATRACGEFDELGSEGGGKTWNSSLTRRHFLKRTGGATVATFVVWNLTAVESHAAVDGESAGVSVTIPDMDLGIDKNGYRNECHELQNPPQWIWKYGAPGDTCDSTLPHDPPDADGKLPRYLTITAVVSPAEKAGSVSFGLAGDEPDCIVIDKKTIKENGVVELQIRALKASTPGGTLTNPTRKPNGTLIQAVYKNKVVGKGKFYVLKPYSIKKDPTILKAATGITPTTLPFHAEYEGQPVSIIGCVEGMAPPQTVQRTYYLLWCDIFILDQYKVPLASIYGGTAVEEKFPDGQFWVAWMGNGSYSDPVGSPEAEDAFNVTHQVKIAGWDLSNIMKRNLDFEFPVVNGQIRTDLTISHAP